ncbi:methyltransferase domain-containing protein [Rahnella sp. ChDrAdgB13]|uniref:methyltransferase domain-containing protein n=1 Tax=Rahnella sp. ChDrAdgB13 TaxID=1850581 RepID=UPI001AD86359|nr:methyltransferase domain-containing protein [Rahnella sp. ChDrAdgB13]
MSNFNKLQASSLVWLPEHGIGRYPVPTKRPYDENYFSRYQEMADTQLGRELTAARVRLVARHYNGPLLDVGIGAGQFVESRPDTKGYDVNPAGVEWLQRRGLWADLYAGRYPALSFWDAIEHIDRPEIAVGKAEKWVFVSVPIFENAEHILRSRHFRKNEHIFYFTHSGLIKWFHELGFELAEHNVVESDLGRDGIGSYAFKRG